MSTLRRTNPVNITIRKKKDKPAAKYYDPIYRVGENIVARIGGDDRLGDLYQGDTLLTDERDAVNGHIPMTHHIVQIATGTTAFTNVNNFSYYGALQLAQPKLNEMIQKNPSQNKETIPAQKTSFVLTDVHKDDVDKAYAIGQVLYATPEAAPAEYSSLPNAYRFVLGSKTTFRTVMNGLGLTDANVTTIESKFAVGRAHNGKKAGHGNCYYTIKY